jgi:hypothetical protein
MKTQQVGGILVLLAIIIVAMTYKTVTTTSSEPDLQEAQLTYELEKLQLRQHNLHRYDSLKYYGLIGLLGAANLSLLIIAGAYARIRMKRSSVHTAHIGQHGSIPVHYKDLQDFYPIAVNLSLAEIEAATSTAHQKAYNISRQMVEDITSYTRAIAGKRGFVLSGTEQPGTLQAALPASVSVPSFAELLENGMAAPGKPIIMGFHQGQAQERSLKDLKSLAIAGWQGSGKTMSIAYLVASSVLAYGVRVYIVDPHKNHTEGLYPLIKPLEKTGHVTVINPFDTPTLIKNLNETLERRLTGKESSESGILLVIDELARLAKMDCFDTLVTFLERCTEETRKANITFIGGSHKWTARHFKGRADIRGCMNSMLIHKTKPSQADLLLEDSQDKRLVKHIHRPGDAILVTDFSHPTLVSMPYCTPKDMERVTALITHSSTADIPASLHLDAEPVTSIGEQQDIQNALERAAAAHLKTSPQPGRPSQKGRRVKTTIAPSATSSHSGILAKGIIPFDFHLKKRRKLEQQSHDDVESITLEHIQEQYQIRKEQNPGFTQRELAHQAGISVGHLSNILRGKCPLSTKNTQRLYKVLFLQENLEKTSIRG